MATTDPTKLKVEEPETIKDIELPILPQWEGIINRPTSLSDLDQDAQDDLDNAGATLLTLGDLAYLNSITTTEITDDAVTTPKLFAGAVTAAKISVGDLSAISANIGAITAGTIDGVTITGGTIRTASSGARVQMLDSTNTLQILDSSNVIRAESYSNGWQFNNSIGNASGRVFIENTFGNLQIQAVTADLFLTSIDDITFAPGNGSISMYIDGSSKDLVLNSGDLVLGNTTIAGGGSWTLTLPSTNGVNGEVLTTDGSGNTSWDAVSGGADTDLGNLTTTSINQSLIPGVSTIDLGTSTLPWDRGYIDDVYLTNGDGGIYYNANLALDFYATRIELGSTYSDLSPASSLSSNFGDTNRWNAGFFDTLDLTGAIDMNNNRLLDVDELRLHTGSANSAGVEGAIAFYDSGTIQYRGQIISTEYSFDLTAA